MNKKITVRSDNLFCAQEVSNDDRFYIKQEQQNNDLVWAIYSPEGERMAQAFSREVAMAIVRQNDLIATQVH